MQTQISFEDNTNRFCKNCGHQGHIFRNCNEPITSFGIIAFIENNKYASSAFNRFAYKLPNQICDDDDTGKFLCLLVQRKDTMGFVDFIRGNYDNENLILTYFNEMTDYERQLINNCPFDFLWKKVWSNHSSKAYFRERENAEKKFKLLNISDLLNKTQNTWGGWKETEYGFPKGRLNSKEFPINGALREFQEETNYPRREIQLFDNNPIIEEFNGTNGVRYKHVYYLGYMNVNSIQAPRINYNNVSQIEEIKNLGWFSFNQALSLIRNYDVEKKKILKEAFLRFKLLNMSILFPNIQEEGEEEDEEFEEILF